ncbi:MULTISPECIES: MAG1140 family protein [unclassified Mycoplasma]|uniref:MAG1140 family protein n=1 Tax=unclassified Mycoplasma TaxID=2683645 RepID=UPI00211D10C0|nr:MULTISPECIES: hypothetical protein [unclassified Mycoplasma]UUM19984.1 hypothetical protein NPA11_00915 [Mycoplasma sp. 1578d]UUM24965.1 hypothetical protein NPA12_00900 [Mycoplasma sp. 3686d]
MLLLLIVFAFMCYIALTYQINSYKKVYLRREYDDIFLNGIKSDEIVKQPELNVQIKNQISTYSFTYVLDENQIKIISPSLLLQMKENNILEIYCTYNSGKTTFLEYILKHILPK